MIMTRPIALVYWGGDECWEITSYIKLMKALTTTTTTKMDLSKTEQSLSNDSIFVCFISFQTVFIYLVSYYFVLLLEIN